jgi:hypothetical protein
MESPFEGIDHRQGSLIESRVQSRSGVTALDALYRVLHRYDRTQGYFCRTRV